MNTNGRKWIWIAMVMLVACRGLAQDVESVGSKIARIDMGSSWRSPKKINIKRCEYLIKELAARYDVTEIEVADASVVATHTLLKERYGIDQKIQETLEGVYKAQKWKKGKQGLSEVFALYVTWVDQNK